MSGEGGGQSISVENFSLRYATPTEMWKYGFAPSCCSAVMSGPSYSEMGWTWGISPLPLSKIHHPQSVRRKLKDRIFFFVLSKRYKGHSTWLWAVYLRNLCMQIVAPQIFYHSSVHFSEEIESDFIPEHNFGIIHFMHYSNLTRTTDGLLKRIISTNCCIHTGVPPDDGLRYARNM
jgi:hypothetical protein